MLLCLSGLRLWWPVGRWRASYFLVRLTGGWKRANFDLHRASGLALGLPMLLMAATGATIAFWAVVTPAAYLLTWSAPTPGPELEVRPPADAEMISPDRALGVAMARHPGFEPRRLYPPAGPDRPYRVFLDPPGEHETRLNEARLEIDPYSGEVLFEEGPATMSRGDRLLRWVLPLHFGTFGGTATKLAYLVSCLGPALLAATGTALWWNRRRKAKAHRPRLPAEAEEEARSLQSA
jgi:uncharacterized iron-regulated membrane protein